jgi:adenylate cyclase
LIRPAWLGEEVTDDRRFYNAELANHPYSDW